MAKRFQDTEECKSHFVRNMPGQYRAFWFWLKVACDHAGLWEIDLDEARMRTGFLDLNKEDAERYFAPKILTLPCGEKWFLLDFCEDQYKTNTLDPYRNTAHRGVVKLLHKARLIDNEYNVLREPFVGLLKPLQSNFKVAKDMDKVLDLNIDSFNKKEENSEKKETKSMTKEPAKTFNTPLAIAFKEFREMRAKIKKPLTERATSMIHTELNKLAGDNEELKIAILNQSVLHCYQDVYPLKDKKPFTQAGKAGKLEVLSDIVGSAEYREQA